MGTKLWRNSSDGNDWPFVGEKYLICIGRDLTLQHEIYEFDQADDGMGGGDYFWSRDDLDECPIFIPDRDLWFPVSKIKPAFEVFGSLYEALQELLIAYEHKAGNPLDGVAEDARAALAKARGEQ